MKPDPLETYYIPQPTATHFPKESKRRERPRETFLKYYTLIYGVRGFSVYCGPGTDICEKRFTFTLHRGAQSHSVILISHVLYFSFVHVVTLAASGQGIYLIIKSWDINYGINKIIGLLRFHKMASLLSPLLLSISAKLHYSTNYTLRKKGCLLVFIIWCYYIAFMSLNGLLLRMKFNLFSKQESKQWFMIALMIRPITYKAALGQCLLLNVIFK